MDSTKEDIIEMIKFATNFQPDDKNWKPIEYYLQDIERAYDAASAREIDHENFKSKYAMLEKKHSENRYKIKELIDQLDEVSTIDIDQFEKGIRIGRVIAAMIMVIEREWR